MYINNLTDSNVLNYIQYSNNINELVFNNCKLTIDAKFVKYYPCALKFTNCDIILNCYDMIGTDDKRQEKLILTIESYNSNIKSITVDELTALGKEITDEKFIENVNNWFLINVPII